MNEAINLGAKTVLLNDNLLSQVKRFDPRVELGSTVCASVSYPAEPLVIEVSFTKFISDAICYFREHNFYTFQNDQFFRIPLFVRTKTPMTRTTVFLVLRLLVIGTYTET